ncbi:MAG: AAA family ATPase [Phycisphaerae bacterium]|nr:AAA family ATPase [Phycisphaerae bacterium]
MIRRVRIRGYKSLKDVTVDFRHPLTVVIGANASGKSNLLDALGLVSRMALSPTLEEAFRQHRGRIIEAFTFGLGGLREALTRESLCFSIEVDVELSEPTVRETEEEIACRRRKFDGAKPDNPAKVVEQLLRYRIEIEYRPSDNILCVLDENLSALRHDGKPSKSRKPFLSCEGEEAKRVIRLRLEGQASRPTEFDVGLPYTVVSRPHYAPHYPHIEAFKRELSGWRFYYLEPRVMRAESDLKVISVPGHYGEDLAAFFHTLKSRAPKQFEATCKALRHILPVVEQVDVEKNEEGLLRLSIKEGGTEFSARVMSEGTLRLLGLLAILQPHTPATTIGFEEPENGVHPRRIGTVAQILENIGATCAFQIIVNTHSPILAEYVSAESLLLCRSGRHGAAFEPFPEEMGSLFKRKEIASALTPEEEESAPSDLMERIIRGDFGG